MWKMEVNKWRIHFRKMALGELHPNHDGNFAKDENQHGGMSIDPPIKFVTPLARAVDLAKSELKENAKSYKGEVSIQNKRKKSFNKSVHRKEQWLLHITTV